MIFVRQLTWNINKRRRDGNAIPPHLRGHYETATNRLNGIKYWHFRNEVSRCNRVTCFGSNFFFVAHVWLNYLLLCESLTSFAQCGVRCAVCALMPITWDRFLHTTKTHVKWAIDGRHQHKFIEFIGAASEKVFVCHFKMYDGRFQAKFIVLILHLQREMKKYDFDWTESRWTGCYGLNS